MMFEKYLDTSMWTYGAEHELADWDIRSELPSCVRRNYDDYSIVNSNGIANDPTGFITYLGGELNTEPTSTIDSQVEIVSKIKEFLPDAKTNYHSNLHLHIRIPGLENDLNALKFIQKRIHSDMPLLLPIIDPLECRREDYFSEEDYKIARKRINHSKNSRHKLLTQCRLEAQLNSNSVEEFFNNEPPISKDGKPLFYLASRVCINLRSLQDNGTIEFRHWAGTLDENEFKFAFLWCQKYLFSILNNRDLNSIIEYSESIKEFLPKQDLVDVKLENSFNSTSVHKNEKSVAKANAEKILGDNT